MTVKSVVYEFLVRIKQLILPDSAQEKLEDLFFARLPIVVIKALTVEYRGYLKHYFPKSGHVVVDAGAWKGHFSIILSRLVGKEGLVIAIEPQALMCDRLTKRLKRLQIENVIIRNCGLYSNDVVKDFAQKNTSSFSIISQENRAGTRTESIALSQLDTVLKEVGVKSVDFIKMDVEGAEMEALAGASKTINAFSPQIAIASYHIVDGEQTAYRVEQILRGYGYVAKTGYPAHLTTYGFRKNPVNL